MSQRLEDFAADQRVRGDTTLAFEVYELLDERRELGGWQELDVDGPEEAGKALVLLEALVAKCEHCESLNFDADKPVESLRDGLAALGKTSDEMIDLRELLQAGGYLARDDRTTPLASLVALFMPPLA